MERYLRIDRPIARSHSNLRGPRVDASRRGLTPHAIQPPGSAVVATPPCLAATRGPAGLRALGRKVGMRGPTDPTLRLTTASRPLRNDSYSENGPVATHSA